MTLFSYTARNRSGEQASDVIDSASRDACQGLVIFLP